VDLLQLMILGSKPYRGCQYLSEELFMQAALALTQNASNWEKWVIINKMLLKFELNNGTRKSR